METDILKSSTAVVGDTNIISSSVTMETDTLKSPAVAMETNTLKSSTAIVGGSNISSSVAMETNTTKSSSDPMITSPKKSSTILLVTSTTKSSTVASKCLGKDMEADSPNSSKTEYKVTLMVLSLMIYTHTTAVVCSIRYGFLAKAFSSRGIPGKEYGLIEGSIFLGYLVSYISKRTEYAMRMVCSKYLLLIILSVYFITTLATGLAYLVSNDRLLVIISLVLRIIQGMVTYPASLVAVDFINFHFQSAFDKYNGFLNMALYAGHGFGETLGSFLYDHFGYIAPFLYSAGMCILAAAMVTVFVPTTQTYLALQNLALQDSTARTKTTPFIIFPLFATAIINCIYGFLQVSITPYLNEKFGKSLTYGAAVLTSASIAMGVGSLVAGYILQIRLINPCMQMSLGAGLVAVGLFFTFTPPFFGDLYNATPYSVFPAVFSAGFGDPFITNAALRVMLELQLYCKGKVTPDNATTISGVWLIGYSAFYYSGSFLAGILIDLLPYHEASQILTGVCGGSFIICLILRFVTFKASSDCDELKPLLRNAH